MTYGILKVFGNDRQQGAFFETKIVKGLDGKAKPFSDIDFAATEIVQTLDRQLPGAPLVATSLRIVDISRKADGEPLSPNDSILAQRAFQRLAQQAKM